MFVAASQAHSEMSAAPRNDGGLSKLTVEITPLPTLPFDLITEILCLLPVKSLMKFSFVCKPWNSLISDPNFVKKHLHTSTLNPNLILISKKFTPQFSHMLHPLRSIFTNFTTTHDCTPIKFPLHSRDDDDDDDDDRIHIVASCDGILCLTLGKDPHDSAVLWNPSIRKYKILPPLENPRLNRDANSRTVYGFGYDHINHNYKVVAVFRYKFCDNSNYGIYKTQTIVKVHTLGTNSWKLIDGFPYGGSCNFYFGSSKFLNGTINWLVSIVDSVTLPFILSLDLATESYQEILQPDYGDEGVKKVNFITLEVLRDCLCIFRGRYIWLMKEYGNRDSWTKFATVPKMDSYMFRDVLYISEDDQVLLELITIPLELKLVVYDSINRTLKSTDIKTNGLMHPKIYVESLISPCF